MGLKLPQDGVEVPEYRQALIVHESDPEPPRGLVFQDAQHNLWQYNVDSGSWEGPHFKTMWGGIWAHSFSFPWIAANPEDEPDMVWWESDGSIDWVAEKDRAAMLAINEVEGTSGTEAAADEFEARLGRFETKDSGERVSFDTGMQRDTNKGKPRFDLLWIKDMPYEEQPLYRLAMLMARGAEKYDDRNWEKASLPEERDRFIESRLRHTAQSDCGELDEDHDAAVLFNTFGKIKVDWEVNR